MSKCIKCGRHGLFLFVNIHTGLCSECQKKLQEKTVEFPQSPVTERSIEIPTVYIGNSTKSKLTEKFEDIKLQCPESLPDFSKIDCCDNVKMKHSVLSSENILFLKYPNHWNRNALFFHKYSDMTIKPEKYILSLLFTK